jgi:hypothetical protein
MPDRRAACRYELSLPITVRVPSWNLVSLGYGTTLDMSTGGVCFTLESASRPGTVLSFTVKMPRAVTGPIDVFIHGVAKVMRVVAQDAHRFQIAAAIEHYEISRSPANL